MASEIPITPEGLAEVKRELDALVNKRRPEIVARIKAARELGDLSENFEYHSARNEQSFIEGRVQELESIVRNHTLIQPAANTGRVELLSTVRFSEEGGPDEQYQLVGPAEADPKAGRVSHESAIGKALLGHRVGDEVEVVTDNGFSYTVKIVAID
jgi:transcription elongation factor GreA